MGRKLNVSNLPPDVESEQLRDLFGQYGTVETARLIKDVKTGESIGAATVAMKNSRESRAAIEALNGTVQFGQEITVSEFKATPIESGKSGARWGGAPGAGRGARAGFGGMGRRGKARGGDR